MPDQFLKLPLVQQAWMFAARKHHGQTYPGTDLPYLVHIGSVLLALLPALTEHSGTPGFDSELALCCALLHDTVEDTDTGLGELQEIFGDAVAAGVSALTKNKAIPSRKAMSESLSRIQTLPQEVWMVKLADRIANLGVPPAHWSKEKCLSYAHEAQTILDALGGASRQLSDTLASRILAWKSEK